MRCSVYEFPFCVMDTKTNIRNSNAIQPSKGIPYFRMIFHLKDLCIKSG